MALHRSRRDDIVKKGSSVVMARYFGEIEFQAADQALFNYLLLRAYEEILPGAVHQIPVRDALEYARIDRISRLEDSLRRLSRGQVEIDYREPNGEDRSIFAHFLSGDLSKSEDGILRYAFDPILAHFLMEPKVFSLVNVSRTRDLRTLASQRLYEAMQLQYHKKTPVWRVSVDELRDFFQIGDRHPRFDNFKGKVIERAVSDVNSIAEFDVLVEYARGGKGGAVVEVEFTAVSKSHARLIEARTVKSIGTRHRVEDRHTVDMLDGMTFDERGGPAEITSTAVEAARAMIGDEGDIATLIEAWREGIRGRRLTDPDANFLAWLHLRRSRDEDPVMRDIADDVFGNLLDEVS